MGQALVSFNLAGAEVRIPEAIVREQFLRSLYFAGGPDLRLTHNIHGQVIPPALGDIWSDQGGVYAGIVRGHDGQPDHYLIIPTATQAHFSNRKLCTDGTDVTGATSKSDGLANTKALAEAGSELCQEILQLNIDGHKDFYLMSANDAHVAAANVPELFEKDDYYWTSTQGSPRNAFVQYFEYGYHCNAFKNFSRRACAVRRIQLINSTL